MKTFHYKFEETKLPLKFKVSVIFWFLIGLALLFFFAFTFFLVALVSGLLVFIFQLFQRNKTPIPGSPPVPADRPNYYRPTPSPKDDVIDI